MLSIGTNLLLYCYSEASPHHETARQFIESVSHREDVALSEFVLSICCSAIPPFSPNRTPRLKPSLSSKATAGCVAGMM